MYSRVTSRHASVNHMSYLANQNHSGEGHLQSRQNVDNQNELRQQHVRRGDITLVINSFLLIFVP